MSETQNMAISTGIAFILILTLASAKTTENDNRLMLVLDDQAEEKAGIKISEDTTWPGFPYLSQVSDVDVDGDGNLHIFHRGDRIWDVNTFDLQKNMQSTEEGPIQNDTVLVVDTTNGKLIRSWGANIFYMPHGLTVDRHGNTWVTDTGLHQMLRFPAMESTPDLTIGEAFVPGAGKHHLCQPTDVAVLPSGDFFLCDGYCNSRVLMFTKNGRFIKEIGNRDGMIIPHSLTLVPEHDAVCAADRENGRILCYATGTDGTVPGTSLAKIEGHGLERPFTIGAKGKWMFAVNGPDLWGQALSSDHGVAFDIETGLPHALWGPEKGFLEPHGMAVSKDGRFIYVSEVSLQAPKKIYKFNIIE